MNKIIFEDAELFFEDFPLGVLSTDVEFHGCFNKAVGDSFPSRHYAQVNSDDIILRFSLKEKSPGFKELLKTPEPVFPEIKNLLSASGTIKIITSQNYSLKIPDAFWIRYPVLEFHLKHNSENIIHSLYFLW